MAKEQMSLRLPKETRLKLEKLAKETNRTKSFLAIEAIEEYCELQSWQIEAIKEGIKAADEGHVVSHEEIEKEWNL